MRLLGLAMGLVLVGGSLVSAQDTLESSAVIDAPVAEVWKAWTTTEGVSKWMAPTGEVDFRVGGKYRTSYSAGSDLTGPDTIENTILAYDPLRMIAVRNTRAPEGFALKKVMEQLWTVIYFEPVDEGKTRVTVRLIGLGDDEESKLARGFFEKGNASTLDALAKHFKP